MKPNLHYGDLIKDDAYTKDRLSLYADLLKPYLNPGVKILDIGGYMADLKLFFPNFVEYYVADFDKEALKIAKKRGAKVKQYDFDSKKFSDPFKGEMFDILVCTEVLEHVLDSPFVLQSFLTKLKKGGIVLISLPNENMLYHRLLSLIGIGIDSCAFKLFKHLHHPTIEQSKEFIGKYLKIEK
jgi:2-polyprenyl-3-methyl-5-hydroxy-6-metoxy-1,4-benzoquinol methylase